ncbi:MAG: hypothetical protein ACI9W4_002555 [Rhodothermales bacterium]|jgi:hypothetical protein
MSSGLDCDDRHRIVFDLFQSAVLASVSELQEHLTRTP